MSTKKDTEKFPCASKTPPVSKNHLDLESTANSAVDD